MNHTFRTLIAVACGAAFCVSGLGQTPPATVLQIEIENLVFYLHDAADQPKLATAPARTPLPAGTSQTFKWAAGFGDIVAVNGKPAKGAYASHSLMIWGTPTYTPGRMIADFGDLYCTGDEHYAIMTPDVTPIGTIMTSGLCGTPTPPGSPSSAIMHNLTVAGGTGAFLGVRGQSTVLQGSTLRWASMVEDPANRRVNGGGRRRVYIQLLPATTPEVMLLPTGPAVFHSDDFSPVTGDRPARAGEWLVMSAMGLGPTRPSSAPGQPFPAWEPGKEHQVNSPLEVTVGGKAAEVRNAIGWPGMYNVYRVDFRVPEGTAAGTATLGLSVAWISGPEVQIPVR